MAHAPSGEEMANAPLLNGPTPKKEYGDAVDIVPWTTHSVVPAAAGWAGKSAAATISAARTAFRRLLMSSCTTRALGRVTPPPRPERAFGQKPALCASFWPKARVSGLLSE